MLFGVKGPVFLNGRALQTRHVCELMLVKLLTSHLYHFAMVVGIRRVSIERLEDDECVGNRLCRGHYWLSLSL